MKQITIGLLSLIVLSAIAQAKSPPEIEALAGKKGTYLSLYNGKSVPSETGHECEIQISDTDYNAFSIEAGLYFNPGALLDGAKVKVKGDQTIYTTTYDGKRPGGSECGDYGIISGFEENVIVTKDSLTIKQKYRCNLIERVEMIETCSFK